MPDTSGAVSLGSKTPEQEAPEPGRKRTAGELAEQAGKDFPGLPAADLGKYAEVIALREANAREETALGQKYQAGIPVPEILRVKYQILADLLAEAAFPPGTPQGAQFRLEHEFRCQKWLSEQWKDVTDQVIQHRLAAGSQMPPELFQKMMGQQVPPGLRSG